MNEEMYVPGHEPLYKRVAALLGAPESEVLASTLQALRDRVATTPATSKRTKILSDIDSVLRRQLTPLPRRSVRP